MAPTTNYSIKFRRRSKNDLEATSLRAVKRAVREFAASVAAKGIDFDGVVVYVGTVRARRDSTIMLDIEFVDDSRSVITLSRVINITEKSLLHNRFQIYRQENRGRGLSKDSIRLSRALVDIFKLEKINLIAGLEDGGYVWLRAGYYPRTTEQLDTLVFVGYNSKNTLSRAQYDKWFSLTTIEKRAFVLSDEFRDYKAAFLGSGWDTSADLTDPEIRNRIFRAPDLQEPVGQPKYTIRFNDESKIPDNTRAFDLFKRDVEILAATADRKGVKFREVVALMVNDPMFKDRIQIVIEFKDATDDVISITRSIDLGRRVIDNTGFEIVEEFQGRGLGSDVQRIAKSQIEHFDLKESRLVATLDNGAYTWLRYGYYPADPTVLDRYFLQAENKKLTPQQVKFWMSMTLAEKKHYVRVAPNFSEYKQALLGRSWTGFAPTATQEQRDTLFSTLRETRQSRTARLAKEVGEIEINEYNIARARVERMIDRRRRNRNVERRGFGTPAFAQLTNRYIAYGVDIDALNNNHKAAILEIYERVELELVAAIRKIDPTTPALPSAREQRLQALLKQSRSILTYGSEQIRGFVLTDLKRIGEFESKFTASSINAVIGVEIAAPVITPKAVNFIIDNTLLNGAPQAEWWSRQDQKVARGFADAVRTGLLQGETSDQIVRRVQGSHTGRRTPYRTRGGQLRFKSEFAGGILQGTKREATALVRTSVMSVSQKVREQTLKDNSDVIRGMQFLATLDARTTPICQLHSGLVWDTENNPIGHGNGYPGSPPLHFQCRSTLVPVTRRWADMNYGTRRNIALQVDEKQALRRSTQASANGQVSSDLNYEGWLRTQSRVQQEKILGKRRFKLWDEGEIFITAPLDT